MQTGAQESKSYACFLPTQTQTASADPSNGTASKQEKMQSRTMALQSWAPRCQHWTMKPSYASFLGQACRCEVHMLDETKYSLLLYLHCHAGWDWPSENGWAPQVWGQGIPGGAPLKQCETDAKYWNTLKMPGRPRQGLCCFSCGGHAQRGVMLGLSY